MFQITSEEQQGDSQGPWRKKRTNLRLEKDYSREGSQGRITRKKKPICETNTFTTTCD